LQGQAADVVHSILDAATYKDILGALKGHYRDHRLLAAYRAQLKTRIQLNDESLQKFAAAVVPLAYRPLVEFSVDVIQRQAAHALVDGMRDR
jgi:hypothetical protein